MENIYIKSTEDTPEINFNCDDNLFLISGRSLPENVTQFYEPVLNWLNELKTSQLKEFILQIKLDYFNTASSKIILDILYILEELKNEYNQDIKIKWYFEEDDEDMSEAIDEYTDLVDIVIEKILN